MVDLERYYIAGSIPGAIASVNEEAVETQNQANIQIEKLREDTFVNVSLQAFIDRLLDAVGKLPEGKALSIPKKPAA